jgi:ribosomal protein S27AE
MRTLPNFTSYKECPLCGHRTFGQFDVYCPRCSAELKDHEKRLAGISDYAKSLLIEFLEQNRALVLETPYTEVPDFATEGIRANGNVFFDSRTTRCILAEHWNEVEIALDDYRETALTGFHYSHPEQLHVFCVAQHAEIAWRDIEHAGEYLSGEELERAIACLIQA